MKDIDIQINKARIQDFIVTFKDGDDIPRVGVGVGLYSGTKKISDFTASSEKYYSKVVFEVSPQMIDSIVKISKQLEEIVVRECNRELKQLPESMKVEQEK